MAYQVEYAGKPLHNYVNIRNVKRSVLPPRENFTKDIPSQNGKFYMGYKYAPREISLECTLKGTLKEDYIDAINELAYILDVNVPTKMIISDNPDKYVYAVIDGDTNLERFQHGGNIELKFVCYDPYMYSVETDMFMDEPMKNNSRSVTVDNSGSTSAYPVVDVGFTKDAHFVQCTNKKGQTVLVGTPPDVDKTQGKFDPEVLKDSCEVLTNWTNVGNIVDNGIVDGDLTINGGGYALTCSNFGSGDGWHGGARRRSFDPVKDFKVEVKMQHNSKGDLNDTGAGTKPPTTSGGGSTKYQITADPSLRVRQSRSTSSARLTAIPKGKIVDVSDIQNNWGKVTYDGKTGYIYMQYTKKYNPPSTSSTSSNYKTTDNLRIRSGRGTKYSTLTTIPKGTTVSVSEIKDDWGKVTYNKKTGYSSMKYMSKVASKREISPLADEVYDGVSCEDRMGKIEVYGFDSNGNRIFKMSLRDTSEWYEHTYPEIQVGSKTVLTDDNKTPAPKTKQVKDEKDEKKTVTKKIDSGKYGDWNEFVGWFTIERKGSKWNCKIEKLDDSGKVVKKISATGLNDSSYPTGQLSNVVVWFGKYKDTIAVDVMSVNEIYVTNIGTPPKPIENKPIFKNGDNLVIDFSNQTTRLLRKGCTLSMMKHLDIGSEFFDCPTGESQLAIKSDDKNIDASVTIRKRWL